MINDLLDNLQKAARVYGSTLNGKIPSPEATEWQGKQDAARAAVDAEIKRMRDTIEGLEQYPQIKFRRTPDMGICIATLSIGKMEHYEARGYSTPEALLNAVNHWINVSNKRKLKNENN